MNTYVVGQGGSELTLPVNYISIALLSLLLPNLRLVGKSFFALSPVYLLLLRALLRHPPSTLCNSSTGILGYPNERSNLASNSDYLTSKLLGILFGRALSEKLDSEETLINMNPGIARTRLSRDRGWWSRLFTWLFGMGVGVAAMVVIQDTPGDDGVVHRGFYSEGRDTQPLSKLFTKQGRGLQEKLWRKTMDLLRVEYEDITFALIQVHKDELKMMTGALLRERDEKETY
ncbi:hypothetical protein HOY82DRAFT_622276 [Tuber indicum]|nr:hypothetical protein HOY82DRAFT_622276 [Tuber indicum]